MGSCCCRQYAGRDVVDGWGLLHELLADVVADVLGNPAEEAGAETGGAWSMVSSVGDEPCRSNVVGEPCSSSSSS